MKEITSLDFILGGTFKAPSTLSETNKEIMPYDQLVQVVREELKNYKSPDGKTLLEEIHASPDFNDILEKPDALSPLLDALRDLTL